MAKDKSKGKAKGQGLRVGVDLGGTKILVAVVNADNKVCGEAKQATHAEEGQDAVIQRIVATVREALDDADAKLSAVETVGVGAPGATDIATGMVHYAANLGWQDVPLAARLRDKLGAPVFVDNDVNVGTLAEYLLGAGRGVQHMAAMFVGTGIGGGLIVNGQLYRGFRGAAGEIGHVAVVPDGPTCGCGRRGCLEAVASRTAIERDVQAALDAGRLSVVRDLIAASKRRRLTSGIIAKALEQRDPLMEEVIGRVQRFLAMGIANLVNILDPEMIVLGGGVVESLGQGFIEPVAAAARADFLAKKDAERVRIVPATLGDRAGAVGAALMAGLELARR
ncbi:MAG: ROK family protein [Caldilineales bacterium]|nr:ROK family protein [Caldilineales bacterium]